VAAHLTFLDAVSPTPIQSIKGSVEDPEDEGDGDGDDRGDGDGDGDDQGEGEGDGDGDDLAGAEPQTSTSTDAVQAAGPTSGGCQASPLAAGPLGGPGAAMFLGMVAFLLRRRG
jgi:hypothetical protein